MQVANDATTVDGPNAFDEKPPASLGLPRIWNMSVCLFGVQIVWGLHNVNTSRIFQSLGAKITDLPVLWIAAPATGLLVQPIIGFLSDRSSGSLGRRRPYMIAGALLSAAALVAMPLVDSLWAATVALWVLTASVNIAMEPARALVADQLPEQQRATAFAIQVFFIGSGAVFASALPWLVGVSGAGENTVPLAYAIGAACVVGSVGWTVVTTREVPLSRAFPPVEVSDDARLSGGGGVGALKWIATSILLILLCAARDWPHELYFLAGALAVFGSASLGRTALAASERGSVGLLQITADIEHMPKQLKWLALVQFFTWMALFTMWIYMVPAVATFHFGVSNPGAPAYRQAASHVGLLFATYNGVAAGVALMLPSLVARFGLREIYAASLFAAAIGLGSFTLIRDPGWLWAPMVAIGCGWAAILSLPFAIVASAVPPQKVGVFMGIHNTFVVLPQLFAAAVLGPLVTIVFSGETIPTLAIAGVSMTIAAGCALAFQAPKPVHP